MSSILCFFILFGLSAAQLNMEMTKERIISSLGEKNVCGKQYFEDTIATVKMLDASSKFLLSGILDGNFFDLGYYDECLSIKNGDLDIYGKYCLAAIPISEIIPLIQKSYYSINSSQKLFEVLNEKPPMLKVVGTDPLEQGFHFGLCVPDKCSVEDLKGIYPILHFDEKYCHSKADENGMNVGAIISLVVVGIVILITILSTIYEIVIDYKEMEAKHEALIAFSMYSNGKKLIRSSKNQDQLLCLNGLKALSMGWVVLGHTYANIGTSAAADNLFAINDWMNDLKNMPIMSATLSVDTFFTIGGVLTMYTFMKTEYMGLEKSFKAVPLMYLHRYLRLTPALAILVLIYASGLLKYVSDGPRWPSIDDFLITVCSKYWWSSLLYTQNYANDENVCVLQSWYLSVDMQLFLLSPFILIPLKKWPKHVLGCMYGLIVLGIAIPFYIGYSNKLSGLGLSSMMQHSLNNITSKLMQDLAHMLLECLQVTSFII
ncbi:hypothetical protein HHI36_021869 [Cryptolaemus montrouzieri]|uniref:Nose resistant-to-fluoxetine protein N-terminal domain-containing protein n=1 Tax=Cryptolaemus montrouzieri TaxID=559131 RepID=A0ABD2MYV4_9CUCU